MKTTQNNYDNGNVNKISKYFSIMMGDLLLNPSTLRIMLTNRKNTKRNVLYISLLF